MFEPTPERRRIRLPRIPGGSIALGLGIIVIVSVAIFATTMLVHVGVGEALLLVDPWFKKEVSDVAATGPTWHIKMPWEQAVIIYYATDNYGDTIPCFSSDQLEMRIDVLVRWSLDPNKIRDLYINYPRLGYEDLVIKSVTEETMRLITKKYTALATIEQRGDVTIEIQNAVLTALEAESSLAGALISLELDLKNIGYPDVYTASIEQKLVKEQEKIAAEFEKDRILVLANATAQQLILEAEGQAEARTIVADSVKEAIELIIESTGMTNTTDTSIIAQLYLYLDTLRQISPDVGVLIIGGDGGVPIIYQLPPDE